MHTHTPPLPGLMVPLDHTMLCPTRAPEVYGPSHVRSRAPLPRSPHYRIAVFAIVFQILAIRRNYLLHVNLHMDVSTAALGPSKTWKKLGLMEKLSREFAIKEHDANVALKKSKSEGKGVGGEQRDGKFVDKAFSRVRRMNTHTQAINIAKSENQRGRGSCDPPAGVPPSPRRIEEIKLNLRQHAMKRDIVHACISLGVLVGEDIPMAVINIVILSKTVSKAFDCTVGDASTATWDSTKVIMISLALSMFMIGQKASLVEKIKYVSLYSSTMVIYG